MNIAYLSTFYPFRGGIAQFNASLYRAFEPKVNSIQAFNFTKQYPELLFPGKTQYVTDQDTSDKIPNIPILNSFNPFTYHSAARKIIQTNQPNMLITKFWMPFFAPSLGTVARKLRKQGCKNIAVLDNVIPHEKRFGDTQLINYFLNSYDGYIAMSQQVENDLLSLKPDAKYKFHLHPLYDHFTPAIDKLQARKQLKLPEDKKILLYFGFIRDYKGLDLIIESLQYLDDSYHLVICGEVYGSFDKYQELIDNLGLASKISLFVRYIDDFEVALFFSAADVNLLTYKTATQSGITAIAFHYNLPVIVTDVGGLKEVVAPYNTGLVVDFPHVNLIVEAIKAFFNCLAENPTYFNYGISNFKNLASWNSLADSILELYNEL